MKDTTKPWFVPPFDGPAPLELYYPLEQYAYLVIICFLIAAMVIYFKKFNIESPRAPPSWLPTQAMLFNEDWTPRQKYVVYISIVNMILLQGNCLMIYNQSYAIYAESDKGLRMPADQLGNVLGLISVVSCLGIPCSILLMCKVGVAWAVVTTFCWQALINCTCSWFFVTAVPHGAMLAVGAICYSCEVISMLNRISRMVHVEDMPRVMGLLGSAQTIGQIFFLNLGTWLWHYGPQLPFFIAGVGSIMIGFNTFVAFNKDKDAESPNQGRSLPEIRDDTHSRRWLHPFMIWVVLAYLLGHLATEWSAPVYWPRMQSFGVTTEGMAAVRSVNIVWNIVIHLILGIYLSGKGPMYLLRCASIGVMIVGTAFVTQGPHSMLQEFVELVSPLRGVNATLFLSLGVTNFLSVCGQALLAVTVMPLMRNVLVSTTGEDTWSSQTLAPAVYFACQSVGAGMGAIVGGNMAASLGFTGACSAMAGAVITFGIIGLLVPSPPSKMKGTMYGSSV